MTSRLPRAERCIVDPAKIRDYCLDPNHTRGRHKARVFARVLGLSQADASWLRAAILAGIGMADATCDKVDAHGERWRADLALTHRGHFAIVRTLWLVPSDDGPPRLITCFVA